MPSENSRQSRATSPKLRISAADDGIGLRSKDSGLDARTKSAVPGPYEDRCLVENRPHFDSVDLCHAFGRAKTLLGPMMTAIEDNWGMDFGTLTLDTSKNCFFARSNLHYHYDMRRWALVPSKEVLDKYDKVFELDKDLPQAFKKLHAEFLEGVHTYTILPIHAGMKDVVIHRQLNVDRPTKKTDFTAHIFPYNSPSPLTVTSHLHPKFAILSLGWHLAALKKTKSPFNRVAATQPEADPTQTEVDLTEVQLGENGIDMQQPHLQPFQEHFRIIHGLYLSWTALRKELVKELGKDHVLLHNPKDKGNGKRNSGEDQEVDPFIPTRALARSSASLSSRYLPNRTSRTSLPAAFFESDDEDDASSELPSNRNTTAKSNKTQPFRTIVIKGQSRKRGRDA